MYHKKTLWLTMLVSLVMLLALPVLSACGSEPAEPTTPTTPVTPPAVEKSEFDVVQAAADAYMSSGSKWNIKASDLYLLLNDDDTANAPYVISARKPEHYALGHVPGATNIGWGDLFKAETLSTIPGEGVVIYCYTGHTASHATAVLGTLGVEVLNMKHGMSDWTQNVEVAPFRFDPATARMDYAVETAANAATETFDFPVLDNTASSDDRDILLAAAASYAKPRNIAAKDLYTLLNDEDKGNDPFIVSIRTAEAYAKGHVPGAINIGFTQIAKKENLAKLPTDRPIVIYCYTGHTGSQATALLNLLGYDATNLKFGMTSWTMDTEVAPGAFDNAKGNDFAYVTGTSPK